MNLGCSCFWWDCFACDGGDENTCKLKISPKDEEYSKMYDKYEKELNEKINKVQAKYTEYFKYYKLGQDSLNE